MKIIKATFIGKDGSMGYKKGKQYLLQVWPGEEPGVMSALSYNMFKDSQIYIKRHPDPYNSLGTCPYKNIEAFLANWTNIKTNI